MVPFSFHRRVPKFVRTFFGEVYATYIKPILNHINPEVVSTKASATHMIGGEDGKNTRPRSSSVSDMESNASGKESDASELGPAFALEAPTDTGIDEMLEVIQDPIRSKILDALAAKTLTSENLEFIRAGMDDNIQLSSLKLHHLNIAIGRIYLEISYGF